MGPRLILLIIVSLFVSAAAMAGTAMMVVMMPTIMAESDKALAPGAVSLMGAVLALAYVLLRPRKQLRVNQTAN